MKGLSRHIVFILLAMFILCGISSCIFDRGSDDDLQAKDEEQQTLFVLHISPLELGAQSSNGVVEKIKSLRVIAVSKNGNNSTIEINRLEKFNDVPSSEFSYAFTWRTIPGEKDFYIIANEESVGNISFASSVSAPENVQTLSDLLNYYKAKPADEKSALTGKEGSTSTETIDYNETSETASNADNFKQVINAVYSALTYTPSSAVENSENTDGEEAKQIFLPYSVCYEDITVEGSKYHEQTMYLVPVATKFFFKFINYRSNKVAIKKIEVSNIDTHNFLLAQVGGNDKKKAFLDDSQTYYWVDWLAKVAKKIQEDHTYEYDENYTINEQYGWITDYSLPSGSEQKATVMFEDENTLVAGKNTAGGNETPGELALGPYYYPESQTSEIQTETGYFLTLNLLDQGTNDGPYFDKIRIGNLTALFRDTHVMIYVRMTEGNVDIYAEQKPWNVNTAYGTVGEYVWK